MLMMISQRLTMLTYKMLHQSLHLRGERQHQILDFLETKLRRWARNIVLMIYLMYGDQMGPKLRIILILKIVVTDNTQVSIS